MELFEAVADNNVIKVMHLLQNGIDPNIFDQDKQYSALHYAVQSDALDVVLLLITAGADLEIKTEENMTVFDIARQHKNKEMMNLLIRLGHMRLVRNYT